MDGTRPHESCVADEALAQFVDGAGHAELRAAIETHLDRCEACRTLVSELARADASDTALEATLPEPRVSGSPTDAQAWSAGGEAHDLASHIGRYRVTGPLGMGASGVVLAAYDPELDRPLAIKLLRSGVARAEEAPAARDRLQREARAMARIAHPHVVAVYDVGTFGDRVFVAMELVQGQTLRAYLAASKRTVGEIIALFTQAGAGLVAAHQAGLVHRDFKPDNVLVGHDARVRVTDFGLASIHAQSPRAEDELLDSGVRALNVSLTVSGVALGTPRYMAPEQHAGAKVDARADQFAFAVALYEALTGEHPFPARSYGELRTSVMAGELEPSATFRALPVHLQGCLRRGLAVRAHDRYPSMEALLEALQGNTAPGRRRGLVVVLSLLLLACAWALRFVWSPVQPHEHEGSALLPDTRSEHAADAKPVLPETQTNVVKTPDAPLTDSSQSQATAAKKPARSATTLSVVSRVQGRQTRTLDDGARDGSGAVDEPVPVPDTSTKFVGPRLRPDEF